MTSGQHSLLRLADHDLERLHVRLAQRHGSKVDPMRVRLPESRTLEDEALAAFEQERRRISFTDAR